MQGQSCPCVYSAQTELGGQELIDCLCDLHQEEHASCLLVSSRSPDQQLPAIEHSLGGSWVQLYIPACSQHPMKHP